MRASSFLQNSMTPLDTPPSRLEQRIKDQGPAPQVERSAIDRRTVALCAACSGVTALIVVIACRTYIDWQLIASIPGPFWAAVLIGPLTLTGVLLTNGSHDRRASAQIAAEADKQEKQLLHDADRLAMQLDHAATEARLQRESDMRQDVFFTAAAEQVRANAFIGSMFKLDFEQANALDGITEFAAANAKIAVVSDSSTAAEAQRLAMLYGRTAIVATPVAIEASSLNVKAKAAEAKALELASKVEELKTEASRYDQFDVLTSHKRQQAINELRRAQKALSDAWEKSSDLFLQTAQARHNFQVFLRPRLDEISRQQIRVLAFLRRELGQYADEEQMTKEWEEMRDQILGEVDSVSKSYGLHSDPTERKP
ncbi:hypothetical protein ACHMXE_20620 [Variovorax sp. UC122_21]